jgi:NADP-dependent 3-hydroxy acid dehydrogenase YdfG
MTEYKAKVAVITGAANGIGRGLAIKCADMGMKLALGDIDAGKLDEFEQELKARGVEVISSAFNVAKLEEMEEFAAKVIDSYGAVDLFFNNAGVAVVGNIWNMPMRDWNWAFDINVYGIIHGIRAFVPFMIGQDKDCIIVNTASSAGLLIATNSPAYVASKHAAVALTEVLNMQLQVEKAKLRSFVLCPGFVLTNLAKAEENRPQEYDKDAADDAYYQGEDYINKTQTMIGKVEKGIPVEVCVDRIFKAIENDNFYIITHNWCKPAVETRAREIVEGKRPMPSN